MTWSSDYSRSTWYNNLNSWLHSKYLHSVPPTGKSTQCAGLHSKTFSGAVKYHYLKHHYLK